MTPSGQPILPFSSPLERAVGYPYSAPEVSYRLDRGHLRSFSDDCTSNCQPLVAIGSNISPVQLLHKFGFQAQIAVQRAWLPDHDVVFAARFSPYGAIPAMLTPSSGTEVFLAVVWLPDHLWPAMDASEAGGYIRQKLNVPIQTLEVESLTSCWYYESIMPPLTRNDAPLAIASLSAKNRRFEATTTADLLERVRRRVGNDEMEKFIFNLVNDSCYRRQVEQKLPDIAGGSRHDRC